MNVLIAQPDHRSAPGELLVALEAEAITYRILLEKENFVLPEEADAFEALIVLGGVMGADDDADHPYLTNIKQTIVRFSEQGKPVLGICLGAQLIASAFGRKIEVMDEPEFGITEITKTKAGKEDPVFNALPDTFAFMEYHNDRFNLPDGATLLASTAYCSNQAFRMNDNIYAVQFHPEVNEELIRSWVAEQGDWMESFQPDFIRNLETEIIPALIGTTKLFREMVRTWAGLAKKAVG
ncbi:type 1 glutamine amidotransferase [Planococcus lenghuensis]|uniref:Glutamine amidotransferase domain-containing protein n=1 Tax=Planococcus lenghuensis TaxID=2213202 RepID=A0A1Q2L134_9BACL|nr:type 1 glutamine amidotransferase [Planococcus lenghuensis]AQQ54084.1 hypothetical protein B0X71_13880 [Planococcus lenghuensis]